MSRNAQITEDFADGTYPFRLAIGELEELQEKTNAGPYTVLRRLVSGDFYVADIRETIRLGLIGGGASAGEAMKLTRQYVDAFPLFHNTNLAVQILSAALQGVPDEQVGKSEAAEAETEANDLTDASLSPDTTQAE
jgi:hypothetical protein